MAARVAQLLQNGMLGAMRTRGLLLLMSLLTVVAGCPKKGPSPENAEVGAEAAPSDGNAPERTAISKPGEVGFAPCLERPCMYHMQTAAYHECFTAADGQCFHFGARCTPKGGCMFDASSATYRSCESAREGACERFGATCAPEGDCMLDPRDGRYRQCEDRSGGKCKRFGDLCRPAF